MTIYKLVLSVKHNEVIRQWQAVTHKAYILFTKLACFKQFCMMLWIVMQHYIMAKR